MDYVIAIPTFDRYKVISKKTLKLLQKYNIPSNKIFLFVASPEQQEFYKTCVDSNLYREIIVGIFGIVNQRNFISNYFPENQYIISMDDDIEDILVLEGTPKSGNEKLVSIVDLEEFFINSCNVLITNKSYIWGIYPVKNPFFMSHKTSTELKFLIGVMYGFINRHLPNLKLSIESETKEDYEQSILFFRNDGSVIRFNNITIKTKFNAIGGLGTDRQSRNQSAADYLKNNYTEISSIFFRKDGNAQVKMKKILNFKK